jgi:hypothetical protein
MPDTEVVTRSGHGRSIPGHPRQLRKDVCSARGSPPATGPRRWPDPPDVEASHLQTWGSSEVARFESLAILALMIMLQVASCPARRDKSWTRRALGPVRAVPGVAEIMRAGGKSSYARSAVGAGPGRPWILRRLAS